MALYDNWIWDYVNKIMIIVADDVRGGSEANPFTFSDIPDAIVAKGWDASYNESASGNQLEFGFRIRLGDGTTTTWLVDTKKQVTFRGGIITANDVALIEVKNNANLRLGALLNATEKSTTNGVSLVDLEATYRTLPINVSGTTGVTKLYSFVSVTSKMTCRYVLKNGHLYNSKFTSSVASGVSVFLTNMDVFNSYLANGYEGWANPSGCTLDRLYFFNSYYGCRLVGVSGAVLKNIYGRNNTYAFSLDSRNTNYIVNADIDTWTISWYLTQTAKTYRQYEFNRKILKEDGSAYTGKAWTLKDKDGNTVASGTTQADGKLSATDLVISHGYFDQAHASVEQVYAPFDLWVDGETDYLDLNILKIPIDTKDVTGIETMVSVAAIVTHLTDIKGTGFVKDTHSLTNLDSELDSIEGKLDSGTSGLAALLAHLQNIEGTGFDTTKDSLLKARQHRDKILGNVV